MNNRSRYLGNSKHAYNNTLRGYKSIPTYAQKKFFRQLCALCRENNIEFDERPYTRIEYSDSIDNLLAMLKEAGVDVKGNGKEFAVEVTQQSETIMEPTISAKLTEIKDK